MFKFHKFILKQSRSPGKLPLARINCLISSTVTEVKSLSNGQEEDQNIESRKSVLNPRTKNMVAAAFASLRTEGNSYNNITTPFTDEKINKAKSVEELLSISVGTGTSRRHALKVLSVLAQWTTESKINLVEFESDPRFLKLCRILLKGSSVEKQQNLLSKSEDLATVLSITADDEAAKMVENITLPQMVKVMSTLSQKKRRSSLLLRALAYNITASSDQLTIKQCGDLLFSMATLNFYDENVLFKITGDVLLILQRDSPKKSAVVGSIFTSLGLLKYKNIELLDGLSDWVVKNYPLCRPQDVFSMLMTLGLLNYIPSNFDQLFEVVSPLLTQSEAGKSSVWLEIVWSLMLLNRADSKHISSVLEPSFIKELEESDCLKPSSKLKLLNIDGAARYLVQNYKGPTLALDDDIRKMKISHTKEKCDMVEAVIDSLKSLISETYLKTRIDTKFGFIIDAEFILDKSCKPHPFGANETNMELTKIAVVAYDYHDMCKGRIEPTGINVFARKILEKNNYKVLVIPYTDFKVRDKIVHRVQYLESRLKEIISNSS